MLGNFIILLCLANVLPDVKDLEIIDERNILLSCERGIGQSDLNWFIWWVKLFPLLIGSYVKIYWETDVYIFVYVDGVINIAYFNKLVGIKLLNNS